MIQSTRELSKPEQNYIGMCAEAAQSNTDAVERLRHGAVLIDPKGSCAKGCICGIKCYPRSYW
jgi:hypothetical protein